MTAEAPATPQPRRRRWKRWAVALGALVGVVLYARHAINDDPIVAQARDVTIGMTYREVFAKLGMPHLSRISAVGEEALFGEKAAQRNHQFIDLQQRIGWDASVLPTSMWPVVIRFDANGRVDR